MKQVLFPLIILILGCEKEPVKCISYNLVTESSEDSARKKCNGLANSHPTFKVISSNYVGCLTKDEYIQAKKGESIVTKTSCTGVTFTIRTVLK